MLNDDLSELGDASRFDTFPHRRLNEAREKWIPWKQWGPYLGDINVSCKAFHTVSLKSTIQAL